MAVFGKWAPWLVTIVVFYLVFRRVSFLEVADAALQVNLRIFVPLLVFNLFFHYFWDSLVFTLLFRWFGVAVSYRGMLPVRGASYLLIMLNFIVGQGGMAFLMNRWKEVPIKRSGSIILFTMLNDYYLLLTFCLVGAFQLPGVDLRDFFKGTEEGDLVRFIVISWMYFVFHIWFYRHYLRHTKGWRFFKESEVFSGFREAPLWLYFKLGSVKLVNFLLGLITCYFALTAFGLYVPLLYLSVFLPIVWIITSIPITIMGLGTSQAAMIWLVAGYAQGSGGPEEIKAAVLAYSLLWWLLYNLGRFGIGVFCVTRLRKSIWMPKKNT